MLVGKRFSGQSFNAIVTVTRFDGSETTLNADRVMISDMPDNMPDLKEGQKLRVSMHVPSDTTQKQQQYIFQANTFPPNQVEMLNVQKVRLDGVMPYQKPAKLGEVTGNMDFITYNDSRIFDDTEIKSV